MHLNTSPHSRKFIDIFTSIITGEGAERSRGGGVGEVGVEGEERYWKGCWLVNNMSINTVFSLIGDRFSSGGKKLPASVVYSIKF